MNKFFAFMLIGWAFFCGTAIGVPDSNATAGKHPISVYELAYTTYLANKDLTNALHVAQEAVKYYPDNLSWRRKLVDVATWSDDFSTAVQQQFIIAQQTNTRQDIAKAVKLARDVNDLQILQKLYLQKIKLNLDLQDSITGYAQVTEDLGEPDVAAKFLKSKSAQHPSAEIYAKLAKIYHDMGDTKGELAALGQQKKYQKKSATVSLKIANAHYTRKNLEKAYKELLRAKYRAKNNDYEFWHHFAEVAWNIGENREAFIAYQKLYYMNRIDSDAMQRLLALSLIYKPKFAWRVSLAGWRKYNEKIYLTHIFILAPSLEKWDELKKIMASLSVQDRQQLLTDRAYINAVAKLYIHERQIDKALLFYARAIAKNPAIPEIKVDYLWFLITEKQIDALKMALQKWYKLVDKYPILLPPYTVGLKLCGRPDLAAQLYASKWGDIKHNYDWLIHYSYILAFNDMDHFGYRMRAYAANKMSQKHKKISKKDRTLYLAYLKILLAQTPGDKMQYAIAQFGNKFLTDEQIDDILMAWALTLNHYKLANFVQTFQQPTFKTAPWIKQTLGLRFNEKYKLKKLLAENVDELPHRDRVVAADRIGSVRVAQQLAYRGLEEHQKDSRMYKLFRETQLPAADYFTIHTKYYYANDLVGPQLQLDGKYFVTPRVYLMPYAEGWWVNSQSKENILTPMDNDHGAGMTVGYRYWRGEIKAGLGYRNSLTQFMNAIGSISYKVNSKLNSELVLGYQQRSTESSALSIAGMRNYIELRGRYQWTVRDSFNGNLSQNYYYVQNGQYLGMGQIAQLMYEHKFQLAYPDWHINLFTSYKTYKNANVQIKGSGNKLIPADQITNTNFFLSDNALEYGIGFGYGEQYLTDYTHDWRTFGGVGVTDNTAFGIGFLANFGIAGSVFGRDHLAFYVDASKAQRQEKSYLYIVGMLYRMYF